jgi:hypothetical protein
LALLFPTYKNVSRNWLEEDTYLFLPDKLRTFEWMLWVSLTRKPLTSEQAKVREEQRKWLREFLEKMPVRPDDGWVEGLTPEQVRARALEQAEQCFSDPLSLLRDPMTATQFENFKRIMGSSAVNGLSGSVANIPVHALGARIQPHPETADPTFDMPLPFDDKPVSIYNGFVLFASNDWLHAKRRGRGQTLKYNFRLTTVKS